jgi:hypothetical protein
MSFIQNPSFEGEIAPWKTISGTVSLSLHSDPSIARSGTQMLSATPSRAGDSFGQDIDLSYLASPPYPTKLQSISCFAWIRTLDTPSSPAPGIYQPLSGRFVIWQLMKASATPPPRNVVSNFTADHQWQLITCAADYGNFDTVRIEFYLDWDYLTAGMGGAVLIDNVNAF